MVAFMVCLSEGGWCRSGRLRRGPISGPRTRAARARKRSVSEPVASKTWPGASCSRGSPGRDRRVCGTRRRRSARRSRRRRPRGRARTGLRRPGSRIVARRTTTNRRLRGVQPKPRKGVDVHAGGSARWSEVLHARDECQTSPGFGSEPVVISRPQDEIIDRSRRPATHGQSSILRGSAIEGTISA